MRTFATMVLFFAIGQVLTILWHFEILTWESMGKPKMWNISKRLIVEQNGRKLGLGIPQCTYVGYLWCLIPWVWFGVIWCSLQNFQFYNFLKNLFLSQFSSNFIQLYGRYPNHEAMQAITFLTICQKKKEKKNNKKKYGILNIFLYPQFHMQLEISKCYFSHNFHYSPSKLFENIVYHGKSKCLLEYCNDKLATSI